MTLALLLKIALIVIMVRSVYVVITLLKHSSKNWVDIIFHLSVAFVALYYYIEHFKTFLGIFP
jgi:hypothetical protein